MRYKVGDKVRIRKDLKPGELEVAGKEMRIAMCMVNHNGKEAVVTKLLNSNRNYDYEIDIDRGNSYWSDEMLEIPVTVTVAVDKTELEKYKELTTLLFRELEIADDVRYKDVAHFITVLRPDLSELFI